MSISYLCTSCHQCRTRANFCPACITSALHTQRPSFKNSRNRSVSFNKDKRTISHHPQYSTRCSPYATTSDYQSMRGVSRQWRSTLGVWKKLDDRITVSSMRFVFKSQFNYESSDRHLLSWSCCVPSSPTSETRIKRPVAENRLARESSDVISAIFVLLIRPCLIARFLLLFILSKIRSITLRNRSKTYPSKQNRCTLARWKCKVASFAYILQEMWDDIGHLFGNKICKISWSNYSSNRSTSKSATLLTYKIIKSTSKTKNKDLSEQSQAFSVEKFAKHCHLHAGTDSDEQSDVDETGDVDTDETIIEPKDIELVTLQVSCSTSKAMTHWRKMRKNG